MDEKGGTALCTVSAGIISGPLFYLRHNIRGPAVYFRVGTIGIWREDHHQALKHPWKI
jgi:hypothetical protein